MGLLDGILGGGEEQTQSEEIEGLGVNESNIGIGLEDTSSSVDTTTNEKTEKDEEREKYLERTSSDRDGFVLHQGEILETHTYETIFNTSWNSDYEGMGSDGSITLPFHKEDLQYIYKGVRCLLKTQRFDNFTEDEQIQIDDSDGYLCFITDVTINGTQLELSLCGYEKLLEQENILSFKQQRRSTILEEVIKMAGLVPVVDTTGLPDEIINWSTEKESKKDKDSGSSGGGNESLNQSTKFTDCSTTYDLSVSHTTTQSTGYIIDDIDSKTEYIGTIGKTGTNYADYVKDCKTVCDVVKKFRGPSNWNYSYYADNHQKCASESFDARISPGINCGDSARLLKCCMDVVGIPCVVIHTPGHYFNAVKVDGKWTTVDLCRLSDIGKKGTTNEFGC